MSNQVLVGISGWRYPDWEGVVFPASPPRGYSRLAAMAHIFPMIEINTSFYGIPSPQNAALWLGEVAAVPHFRFTAKCHGDFTHRAKVDADAVKATHAFLAPMMEARRLGALLLQFPWSFKPGREEIAHLHRLLATFADYPLAVELRHVAWWTPMVFDLLAEQRAALVCIDQPALEGNVGHDHVATADFAYIRFHGRRADTWWGTEQYYGQRYDYLYSEDQLTEWADRIREISDGVATTFVAMNNHARGSAVVNGMELAEMLGAPIGGVPPCLYDAYADRLQRTRLIRDDLVAGAGDQLELF